MKALICIGHVPDTTSKIRFTNNDTEFDTTDIQYIVGPYEELALTRILDIGGIHITVINVGLQETEPTLRKALAMGADEAIRVNADPSDAKFVAKQIAEVFKNGEYDFIVTGKESIDYNGGQVDGMLAAFLDIASIPGALKFEIEGKKAKFEREMDGGKEVIEAGFPFVTSAGKGFALEPRIPNMRGIMMARRKKLEVVQPVDYEINTEVVKFNLPEAKPECKMISSENAEELVKLLHEEAKII